MIKDDNGTIAKINSLPVEKCEWTSIKQIVIDVENEWQTCKDWVDGKNAYQSLYFAEKMKLMLEKLQNSLLLAHINITK